MAYIVELEAHDGSNVVTLRYGLQTVVSGPADPMPNTVWDGRILDAGRIDRTIFGGSGRLGTADVGYGFLELNNVDRGLDRLKDYAFDGRPLRIWRTEPGRAVAGRLLFRGVMKGIQSTNGWESLQVLIKDRLAELNEPLLTATYAGTTLKPDKTIEGNDDLKDQLKPGAWGAPKQVPLRLVNAYDYLWQVCQNQVASITLYDGGLPLRFMRDYPTVTALMAASLPANTYATCCALGLVRPQSKMAYGFSADVVEGVERSAARVTERMLRHFGLTDADLDLPSFARLHAERPEEVEIFVDTDIGALAAVQDVLSSVYATILPMTDGRLRVVSLKEPVASEAVAAFTLRDIGSDGSDIQINAGPDDGAVPPWKVELTYGRLYVTRRKTELAGAVADDAAKVAFYETATRKESAEASAVKARHLLSEPATFDTRLTTKAGAAGEAGRRLRLLSRQRDRPTLAVFADRSEQVELGDTVLVRAPLLGWDAGKPFRVLSIGDDFDDLTRTLGLWG